ncbi:MAG: hypothetical protein IKK13_04180, partial [Clostridia bacterium]|nr:hypothetical protein [Clostridia bacterium]
GVKTVFIPAENIADLDEIDSACRENIEFIPVGYVSDIIASAIVGLKKPAKRAFSEKVQMLSQDTVRQ